MSNFGPAPSRITAKISPSLDPRSHLSSVRLGGCVPSGAIGPSPLASAPWQKRQFFWNSACPALIDAGDEAIGFFNFWASGLPPGFCATGLTMIRVTGLRPLWRVTKIETRFRVVLSSRSSARHDDRDLLVRHEGAVIRAAAQHVGARLAECDLNRLLPVLRKLGRSPERRPG